MWIFTAEPFPPASFKCKYLAKTFCLELLCQTGTCGFIRSGTVENYGLLLVKGSRPFVKITRWGANRVFDLEFA